MKKFFVIALTATLFASCTSNQMARQWGGVQTINVPANQKLIQATWKEDDLWYLTEPMDSGYQPHDKILQESSSWGVNEGAVIFKETR